MAETIPSCKFFSTGSTLLDLALGGGWAVPFIFNLVGDKSSGKTLLAIEGFANFERTFKEHHMRYAQTEGRNIDPGFAAQLGFPQAVTTPNEPLDTIEDFRDDTNDFMKKCNPEIPGLYILDSLDALSDEAEMKKFETKDEGGTYGTAKAKMMSQLFRMIARDLSKHNCTLGIISQLRDAIGVTFGEQSTRSGGRALNFYASQIVWLREVGKHSRTVDKEDRVVGVDTHAKVKKCSVGMPFREAQFRILLGYGVDDETSMLDFLAKHYEKETVKGMRASLTRLRNDKKYDELDQMHVSLKADTIRIWNDVEKQLAPPIRKYR